MTTNRKRKKNWINYLLIILIFFMAISSFFGLKAANSSIQKKDLVQFDTELTDDVRIERIGGKNPRTNVVFSLNKFQGHQFRVRLEEINSDIGENITELKSKFSVKVGLLKSDYKELTTNSRRWGLIEGFQKFRSYNHVPFYTLSYDETEYISLERINMERQHDGRIQFFGSFFFLLLFIAGLVKARMHQKEKLERDTERLNQKKVNHK